MTERADKRPPAVHTKKAQVVRYEHEPNGPTLMITVITKGMDLEKKGKAKGTGGSRQLIKFNDPNAAINKRPTLCRVWQLHRRVATKL